MPRLEKKPEDEDDSPFSFDWEASLQLRYALEQELTEVEEKIILRRKNAPRFAVNVDSYVPPYDDELERLVVQRTSLQQNIQYCRFEEQRRKDNIKWSIVSFLTVLSITTSIIVAVYFRR